ncbi:DUF6301 family protein [Microbacterium sp. 1.5R]|uniref:DUF6301 family protein n=1 Tax=Microbacterium sp. 1.5R TaxID=1916917 RepID=UPI0011A1E9B5|nr:DUF6301 family protein [Microbacterium sp. 1.5R]
MSWNAMTPAEACDLMDFWAGLPWPLTRDEAQQRAVEHLGWTTEVEDGKSYLINTVSGFTVPDVSTIGARRHLNYVSLHLSDETTTPSAEETAAMGDAFTLVVREGTARWGEPTQRESAGTTSAIWDVAGGARVSISLSPSGIRGMFETPQGVEVERKLGY